MLINKGELVSEWWLHKLKINVFEHSAHPNNGINKNEK